MSVAAVITKESRDFLRGKIWGNVIKKVCVDLCSKIFVVQEKNLRDPGEVQEIKETFVSDTLNEQIAGVYLKK